MKCHLQSDRYALRLPVNSDSEFLFKLLGNLRVVEHHPLPVLQSTEEAENVLKEMEASFQAKTAIFWIIYDKALEEPIGRFALQNINWQNNSAQLLVDVLPEFWGEGLLFEVGLLAMTFGYEELGLHRIEAVVQGEHPFMAPYLEVIGFQKDGVLPTLVFHKDKWLDFNIYSLLHTDPQWKKLQTLESFSLAV